MPATRRARSIATETRRRKPGFEATAVEPVQSPVLSQTRAKKELAPGPHKIQGIGAGFVPQVLEFELVDEIVQVNEQQAIDWANRAAKEEGIFVGISSGAALKATDLVAARSENVGRIIVVILPDFGERYLSSPLFDYLSEQ